MQIALNIGKYALFTLASIRGAIDTVSAGKWVVSKFRSDDDSPSASASSHSEHAHA